MKDVFRVEFEMEQKMCSSCKKSSSEYYEMLLHLRFRFFDDVMEIKKKAMEVMEGQFNTINKIDEVDSGFDIYFRDHGQMNKVLSLFVKDYICLEKRSNKLMGHDRQTSKDLYRHFQSLTLVNIKRGDEVSVRGVDYIVKAINKGGKLVLLKKDTGAKKVVSYSIVEEYFKLNKRVQK